MLRGGGGNQKMKDNLGRVEDVEKVEVEKSGKVTCLLVFGIGRCEFVSVSGTFGRCEWINFICT